MAKRMKYDTERFAKDFAANFVKLGVDTQDEAGTKLGVSQNAIHSWMAGISFPQKDRWETIREKLGIYPGDYRLDIVDNGIIQISHHSAPGQIINGPRLNAMEQDLIDTMRKANLSDWAKISVILEEIKTRG